MIDNVGKPLRGTVIADIPLEAEMQCYDRLPPLLREMIRTAPIKLSPAEVLEQYQSEGCDANWTKMKYVNRMRQLLPKWTP